MTTQPVPQSLGSHFVRRADDDVELFYPWGKWPPLATIAYEVPSAEARQALDRYPRRWLLLGVLGAVFFLLSLWLFGLKWGLGAFLAVLLSQSLYARRVCRPLRRVPRRESLRCGALGVRPEQLTYQLIASLIFVAFVAVGCVLGWRYHLVLEWVIALVFCGFLLANAALSRYMLRLRKMEKSEEEEQHVGDSPEEPAE